MKKFKITLKHDNGKINFIVYNFNEESAIRSLLNSEKAPRHAIIKIRELTIKKSYKMLKEEARQKAVDTLNDIREKNLSWYDWAHLCDYFEKVDKRYGLIKEFKENRLI